MNEFTGEHVSHPNHPEPDMTDNEVRPGDPVSTLRFRLPAIFNFLLGLIVLIFLLESSQVILRVLAIFSMVFLLTFGMALLGVAAMSLNWLFSDHRWVDPAMVS